MSAEKRKRESEIREDDNETRREFGSERADDLGKSTGRVNAVLSLCGGLRTAQAFFESADSQVVVEAALMFLRGKLPIFAELVGDGGRVTGGGCGLAGFTRLVLVVVFAVIVGVVVSRGRVFVFVVGLVVLAIGLVGTIGFVSASTGFLVETFPVAGVNGVSKFLHSFEGRRFTLLTPSGKTLLLLGQSKSL